MHICGSWIVGSQDSGSTRQEEAVLYPAVAEAVEQHMSDLAVSWQHVMPLVLC
jgi:hypothetical protein